MPFPSSQLVTLRPDLAESFVASGIGGDGEHAAQHGALDAFRFGIDDDEGGAGCTSHLNGPEH